MPIPMGQLQLNSALSELNYSTGGPECTALQVREAPEAPEAADMERLGLGAVWAAAGQIGSSLRFHVHVLVRVLSAILILAGGILHQHLAKVSVVVLHNVAQGVGPDRILPFH